MVYLVNITARAARDLVQIYRAINAESSITALRWYRKLKASILSLEEHPHRCVETPENNKLRHLLYGGKPHIYRVIYKIDEKRKQVQVLHIRHGARKKFTEAETK